jgi:hypothetical protein
MVVKKQVVLHDQADDKDDSTSTVGSSGTFTPKYWTFIFSDVELSWRWRASGLRVW